MQSRMVSHTGFARGMPPAGPRFRVHGVIRPSPRLPVHCPNFHLGQNWPRCRSNDDKITGQFLSPFVATEAHR